MIRYTIASVLSFFSVSLIAQTKTFVGADYSQGIVFVMENEQSVLQHKAPDTND